MNKNRNNGNKPDSHSDNDNDNDSKQKILKKRGVLNQKPQLVKDELFERYSFFDPSDLIQVKYEMVRRVNKDKWSIKRASETFGFSRPSFYEAKNALEKKGITGLIPKKRGPKQPHKLSKGIMKYLKRMDKKIPKLKPKQLTARIKKKFGVTLHTRTIYRALEKIREKKTQK